MGGDPKRVEGTVHTRRVPNHKFEREKPQTSIETRPNIEPDEEPQGVEDITDNPSKKSRGRGVGSGTGVNEPVTGSSKENPPLILSQSESIKGNKVSSDLTKVCSYIE